MIATQKVLLVEDEAIIAMEAEMALSERGWTVLGPVSTIEKANNLLNHDTPDIAVLDFSLKNETTEELATKLVERNIPVIFMSGDTRTTDIESLKDCDVLEKPASMDTLDALLRKLLDQPG